MRKILSAAALLLGISAPAAYAQNNAIKINILSPIVRTLSIFGEHKLNDNSSAQLGFLYTGFKVSETKFSGFAITPEYRYYLSDKGAINGFYLGPYLRYQNYTLKTGQITEFYDNNGNLLTTPRTYEPKATFSSFGGGLVVGYQAIFKERISLDAFIGPGFNSSSVKVDVGSEDDFSTGAFSGFSIRPGVTLGLAF